MSRTADVIVIGGGIHGCSTALHLALRGVKPILLEKDYAGRHASGVNAGGVRQLARHIAEVPLSVASMEIWERIGDVVDDDCGFEAHGQVLIAESAGELDGLRARVDDLRLRGFTHEELIDRTELKRLVPAVADHCPGGIVSRRDGAADPFRTTQALRRKAIALGEDQGFIKTIFDKKTGQLLGAHMVGAEVTELIQGFVVAMNLETTEEELMHTIFPHPTLSEMMKESVLDAYGRALNA